MTKVLYIGALVLLLFASCQSGNGIKEGMTQQEVENVLGRADSVELMISVKDVYTNKKIEMKALHYGQDTVLVFADDELIKGL